MDGYDLYHNLDGSSFRSVLQQPTIMMIIDYLDVKRRMHMYMSTCHYIALVSFMCVCIYQHPKNPDMYMANGITITNAASWKLDISQPIQS